MFTQLATALVPIFGNATDAADSVLSDFRPSELSEYLEGFWFAVRNGARQAAFGPLLNAVAHRNMARDPAAAPIDPAAPAPAFVPTQHHHICYAFMLENTRIVDIFRRVVREWLQGERLPTATQRSQRWLQTTEQLFFADAWPYSVRAVTSTIRPDSGAVRRNAYYRLLGMDLNHGTDDGGPYAYLKAEIANRDFSSMFEALLAEVWRGYTNRLTLVAQNLTDNNAITNLVRLLREMLQSRRLAGALSREEFDAVAVLSWFHLTVRFNTQVVQDLNARADGVANRLVKIGERVGLPAHARSDAFIQLAAPISRILLAIESGAVAAAGPASLYVPGLLYTNDMLQIITHWSIATGRDVKDLSTRPATGAVMSMAGSGLGRQNSASPTRVVPFAR